MKTIAIYTAESGIAGQDVRIRTVADCCGIKAFTELHKDGAKTFKNGKVEDSWTVWEETKNYKTERGAINAAKRLLTCHRINCVA